MTTTNRLLRRKEVTDLTSMSNTTLQRLMELDMFPKAIRIGLRAVRWQEAEIQEWIATRERYDE